MANIELLVTVASWEERFILGLKHLLDESSPRQLLMYYFEDYADRTIDNRTYINELCQEKGVILESHSLSFKEPKQAWTTIYDTLKVDRLVEKEIIIDFTTMPREILWTILNLLDGSSAVINYVYSKPEKYNGIWLSRDPGKPRFVYKLGGEAKLGAKTLLLVITGYDAERVEQLVRFFDPHHSLLGIQVGNQYNNLGMNMSKYKQYERQSSFTLFEMDAYSADHGFAVIETQLGKYLNDYNIIMSSLGPKPSAIALYRLKIKYPQTSLAYAPSNEYNSEYSLGFGGNCSGKL